MEKRRYVMRMFYQSTWWWMAPISLFLILACFIFGYMLLPRARRFSAVFLFIVGAYCFFFKIWDNIDMQTIPIEYSSITYFFFGLSLMLPFPRFRSVSSLAAIVAGLMFDLMLFLYPDLQMETYTVRYTLLRIINHNILLLGGILAISTTLVKWKDFWGFLLYDLFAIIYALILYKATGIVGNDVILKIIDGSLIQVILPNFALTWWWYLIWYPGLLLVLLLFFLLFKALSVRSEKNYRRRTLIVLNPNRKY